VNPLNYRPVQYINFIAETLKGSVLFLSAFNHSAVASIRQTLFYLFPFEEFENQSFDDGCSELMSCNRDATLFVKRMFPFKAPLFSPWFYCNTFMAGNDGTRLSQQGFARYPRDLRE